MFEFVLEVAKIAQHVGKFLEGNPLAFDLFVRLGGNAEDCDAVRDVAHDAGFGADGGLAAKGKMAGNAGLGGDDAVVAEFGAASETDLAHDQAMVPHDDIVGDMDEVIDFCAFANNG